MALKIGISSYVSSGYLNPVIYRLYETGTGVFIDEHQELGPHGVVYNFDFVNNIRDIVYTVKMYEQPGGTGVGTLIKAEDVTVTTSTITSDSDIETVVDNGGANDPVSGTSTSPAIASLVGKDFYVVQRSIGQRRVDILPEVTINNDGSYTLLSGETFNPEDTWIIKIRAQYVINPPGSQGLGVYSDVVLKTSDYTVTSADFGKLIIVDGSSNVVTLQLPSITDIISKLSLWIRSVGTNHINVVIKAATGETISATGTTSNTFILGKATEAEIINLGGVLYGFTDDQDIRKVGQMEWGYYNSINRLVADGTEYNVADYPRLKKAIDAMPVGEVVTYTQWNSSQIVDYLLENNQDGNSQVVATKTVYPYQGFYAVSDDNTKFRVPNIKNKFIRALRYTDGTSDPERVTQKAGGYQVDQFFIHGHNVDTSQGEAGVGKFTGGGGADEPSPLYTKDTGGSETRGENIGMFPLIVI